MARTALSIVALLALSCASLAQDAAYYKAIQKASSSKVQPAQFKEMEEKALRDYSQAGPAYMATATRKALPLATPRLYTTDSQGVPPFSTR